MSQIARKAKATIYVKHAGKLLVFSHVKYPEVGLQVPSGTVEPGESSIEAAKRELFEESGLDIPLSDIRFVATHDHDMRPFKDQIHSRDFFEVEWDAVAEAQWRHWEEHPSTGEAREEFQFEWLSLDSNVHQALSVGYGKALASSPGASSQKIERIEFKQVASRLTEYRVTRLQHLLEAYKHVVPDLASLSPDQVAPSAYTLLEHLALHLAHDQAQHAAINESELRSTVQNILEHRAPYCVFHRDDAEHLPSGNYESPLYVCARPQGISRMASADAEELCRQGLHFVRTLGLDETCHGHFGAIVLLDKRELFSASNSYTLSGARGTIYADSVSSAYRMGETILHEATHNWLNDCIQAYGIVFDPTAQWYSPWRHVNRPAVGILQAAVVFARLVQYFKRGLESGQLDRLDALYAEKRLAAETAIMKKHIGDLSAVIAGIPSEPMRSICAEELNRSINI